MKDEGPNYLYRKEVDLSGCSWIGLIFVGHQASLWMFLSAGGSEFLIILDENSQFQENLKHEYERHLKIYVKKHP